MAGIRESEVEDAALAWLEALGYAMLHGPAIAVGEPAAERSDPSYRDVVLEGRLRQALVRLNADLPPEAIDWAIRENVRAQLRVIVKRILRKHGYPPDKAAKATQTVLEQAEVLSEAWL